MSITVVTGTLNTPPDEPDTQERIAAKIDERVGKLGDILAAGVADGTFDPELDPSMAATALWAMMEGVLALSWRTDRKSVASEQLRVPIDFAVATVIAGIRPRR